MFTIMLPYGRDKLTLNVEEGRLAGVLAPVHEAGGGDEAVLIRRALENPIGSERLAALARGKKRVLLITSDHTRPVPSRLTMPPLLAEIRRGSPEAEIVSLVATGVHRPTTQAELRQKLGDEIVDAERIVVHRSERAEDMVFLGALPSGGELWLNRLVKWAELTVAEGFIEPHFFAGFSGGRKSILPGIAARKTVLYNHNAGFIADPHARQGKLEDNPIHRDMRFAAKAAGLAFVLNVILDADKKVVAAVAGHAERAHEAGCAECRRITRVSAVPADVVIVTNGGYPLDQNLYQCVKGMTAAESCVRPGGVIIMCAALGDGHGGEDFYRWFAERAGPAEVMRDIQSIPAKGTRMDQWEAQLLARVMLKANVIVATGEENRSLVESMHMRWAASPEDALAIAHALVGQNAKIAVIPDGVGVIVEE